MQVFVTQASDDSEQDDFFLASDDEGGGAAAGGVAAAADAFELRGSHAGDAGPAQAAAGESLHDRLQT